MMIKQKVSLNHIVVQVEGNIVSDMDGEKVMLSVQNGKYYNLGEVGGIIWDHMKEPITVCQLIAILTSEYVVDQSQCEDQVLSFLDHLLKEKLISVNEKSKSLVK
ncbi:lasso peptide biosynthesis PqqD family chaperone [Metabacillus sp. Hm71]|uniref:lasso peptide biosynthesis PqqD family chaperone n=1 Tax=Metabacillus sp. Hm71 TaxID=3450743 RepID=UPI003F42BDBE